MDYRSCLENAFKPGLMVNTKFKLRQLFSRFYTYEDTKESEAKRGLYLHVMAGGNVETDFPYSARLLLASAASSSAAGRAVSGSPEAKRTGRSQPAISLSVRVLIICPFIPCCSPASTRSLWSAALSCPSIRN